VPAGATLAHDRQARAPHILYIEDNPANVEVVAWYLRTRGTGTLTSCPAGREGLQHVLTHHLDLILLDLHLQDGHGEQALRQLKAEPATAAIPVVVLSANASHGMIKHLIAHDALATSPNPSTSPTSAPSSPLCPPSPPSVPQRATPARQPATTPAPDPPPQIRT